jgi:hypothetical protein
LSPATAAVVERRREKRTEATMKRSSKVVLLFMGTAAAGGLSIASALAKEPCHPAPAGFASPGGGENTVRCMTRSGFGGSAPRFAGHGHGHGG